MCSIASNSVLKLPLPNPCDLCRSIGSKNTVGRSCTGWGEDLRQVAGLVPVGQDAELAQFVQRVGRWPFLTWVFRARCSV